MKKRLLWAVSITVVLLALIAVPGALAALTGQDDAADPTPTETPTPTPTYTPTATFPAPTPTLLPPPAGGGRVAVAGLVVRAGASAAWQPIGGLVYGDEVIPRRRSPDGRWVRIFWNGNEGWVAARYIEWDPSLVFDSLPVEDSAPDIPLEEDTPTAAPTETALPTNTPEPPPPTATTPPTDTTEPPGETPPASDTPLAAAVPPPAAETPAGRPPASRPVLPGWLSPDNPWLWGTGGLIAVLAAIYVWRWLKGRQEQMRYREGFLLEVCPVCQMGELQLDEQRLGTLGVSTVRRTVRCDNCRSVLRQIRPGLWRYTIDPFVNPELAESYNGHTFTDRALSGFPAKAHAYRPLSEQERMPAESPDFRDAVAHIRGLEASVFAGQEGEEETPDQALDDPPPADIEPE